MAPERVAGRLGRLARAVAYSLLPLVVVTLFAGIAIYHFVEGLGWPDSFLNSAMLLGGMGPVNALHTTLGKWLAGFYALFAGLVVIVVAGATLAPVVHHLIVRHQAETQHKSPRGT